MFTDAAAIAKSLSPAQKFRLLKVSANEAVSELEYVSLLEMGLINQPLAGNLPPTTPMGTLVLGLIAESEAGMNAPGKPGAHLKSVS